MLKIQGVLRKIFLGGVFVFIFCFKGYSQWILTSSKIAETSAYVGAGITKMYGDIGGYAAEKFAFIDVNTSYCAGLRYSSASKYGFSILSELNNHYQGDDKETHLSYRSMAFRTTQFGASAQLEITLLGGTYLSDYFPHTIYAFGGVGYSYSKAVFLDPSLIRGTDKVKLIENTPTLFGGLGYQFRISEHWGIGAEYRATQFLSDFIDGYHPKYSRRDDMSMDFRVTLAYFFRIRLNGRKVWDCHCDDNW